MMDPEQVRALLLQSFPEADVQVDDMTGTQDHFDARIVSEAFAGKTRIEQHQLVYAALGEAIHGPIHALKLKTYTPEAWAKIKG